MQAYYDSKPQALEAVGNGSYLYHYNVQEETVDMGEEAKKTQWKCDEVTVWPPVTSNSITEAVIAEQWDANYEQKLVNEYNSATLGLYDETTAEMKKAAYKTFLTDRAKLKAMVDEDCKAWGIE